MNRTAARMSFSRRLSGLAGIAIACLTCCQQTGWPQTVPKETNPAAEQQADATEPLDPATAAELKRQRNTVTIATILLVGICIVGLSLIWMVMVWGRRVRRFARQHTPDRTVVDELWYLKPPKPTVEPGTADQRGPDASSNETTSR